MFSKVRVLEPIRDLPALSVPGRYVCPALGHSSRSGALLLLGHLDPCIQHYLRTPAPQERKVLPRPGAQDAFRPAPPREWRPWAATSLMQG